MRGLRRHEYHSSKVMKIQDDFRIDPRAERRCYCTSSRLGLAHIFRRRIHLMWGGGGEGDGDGGGGQKGSGGRISFCQKKLKKISRSLDVLNFPFLCLKKKREQVFV